MDDIQSRSISSIEYWWECPYCDYWTGNYAGHSWVKYHKGKHEPLCARARELGLVPIFRNGMLDGHNQRIWSWKRKSDGLEMERHLSCERKRQVPYPSLRQALADGWTQEEYETGKPWFYEKYMVQEIRFIADNDWHHPVEVYEVPEDWDWRNPDTEIPWLKEGTDE